MTKVVDPRIPPKRLSVRPPNPTSTSNVRRSIDTDIYTTFIFVVGIIWDSRREDDTSGVSVMKINRRKSIWSSIDKEIYCLRFLYLVSQDSKNTENFM